MKVLSVGKCQLAIEKVVENAKRNTLLSSQLGKSITRSETDSLQLRWISLIGCSTATEDRRVSISVQQASTRYRITKTTTGNTDARSNDRETGTASDTKRVGKGREAGGN
jgi:hypothetical protein